MLGVLSLGRQGISFLYMYQVLPLSDMFVLYLYQKCLRVVFVQVQVYMVGNYLLEICFVTSYQSGIRGLDVVGSYAGVLVFSRYYCHECTELYCTVSYCSVLYRTVLHCIVLYFSKSTADRPTVRSD